jgi:hypothetical protein
VPDEIIKLQASVLCNRSPGALRSYGLGVNLPPARTCARPTRADRSSPDVVVGRGSRTQHTCIGELYAALRTSLEAACGPQSRSRVLIQSITSESFHARAPAVILIGRGKRPCAISL